MKKQKAIKFFLLSFCFLLHTAVCSESTIQISDKLPEVRFENGIKSLALNDMRYLCAGNSVYVVSKFLGLNLSFSEIFNTLYAAKNVKISIAEIENALSHFDIPYTAVPSDYFDRHAL